MWFTQLLGRPSTPATAPQSLLQQVLSSLLLRSPKFKEAPPAVSTEF